MSISVEQTPQDSDARRYGKPTDGLRKRVYGVIFESDTRAGRLFDLTLIGAILASVVVVIVDSIEAWAGYHGSLFVVLEWMFTLLFTLEYAARLWCVQHPLRYATSFFGIIDLVSFLPTYLALFVPGINLLMDIRILRLLRIFRILKLGAYVSEYRFLANALASSRRKILIFLSVVLMIALLMGTLMYVVEGPQHGYTSIPAAMYWAIVTMTTVGYGDVTPHTYLGRFIASFMMLLGWGILAVPTGIVTAEMTAHHFARHGDDRTCPACGRGGHAYEAKFCMHCGAKLGASDAG